MTHNTFSVIDAIWGDQNLDMLVLRKTKLKLAKIPCQIENIQFYKIFNFSAIFGSINKVKYSAELLRPIFLENLIINIGQRA